MDDVRKPLPDAAVAVLAVAGAALVRWLLDPFLGDQLPYVTFVLAVVVASWYGGLRPGLGAAGLGLLLALYAFVPPRGSFAVAPGPHLIGLAATLLVSLAIAGFSEATRVAQRQARRAERRRTARLAATQVLAEAATLDEAAPRLLQSVCENLGWDVGAVWQVDPANPVLRCVEVWHRAGLALTEFEVATRQQTFAPGVGLPGRVWADRAPAWIPDVVKDANFPRARMADGEGLHAAFGFPIRLGPDVLGVMEFFSHQIREPDADLLEMTGTIGGQVGQFLQRRRAEAELRHSEQRFARFMQHLPGLAWIKDLHGRYVYVNDTALRVFDPARDGVFGKTDDQVFPPETAARFKANDAQALASGTGVQVIETLEHEDGIVHFSVVSKFPIPGLDDTPALVGGMAIDITDRLRAEAVLAESEQRFRQLAENINEVFWMADPQTTEILYISPAYEQVWGRPCQGLYEQPRSFLEAIHPEDRERVRVASLEKHSRGEPTDEEYRVIRPDGSVRWVRDRAFPVRDAAGRVYRMVGIAEDVTEKKRAEEALKEADRRKDEFLATLAHELRNPLAPIRNALQILRLAGTNGQAAEQARGMMERQLKQMVRLIDDLLDVSRITRGKLALRRERVELAAVVQSAIETARPLLETAGHELTVALPPEPVPLDADPTRLAQVFANLLTNAAKFTDRGGRIRLAAERQGGKVVVSVRDNGVGIPAESLPRLFEMFSQVAPALERSQGGLGIGLALVKGLAEMHGGSVTARSQGPGQGSEFIVRLPVAVAAPAGRPPDGESGPETRSRSRYRILVVDDMRDAADSLAMLLRLMGHDVRTAHDGLEAVQAAEEYRPEVVLLDIGLPGQNGYEAARRIREQPWGRRMALVAVTGWGQEEDKRRATAAGFNLHLVKPVAPAALEKLLTGLPLPPA
jgi:PAS domain S-box-containing protein